MIGPVPALLVATTLLGASPADAELRIDPRHEVSRFFDKLVGLMDVALPETAREAKRAAADLLEDRIDWQALGERVLSQPSYKRLRGRKRAAFDRALRDWIWGRYLGPLHPAEMPALELTGPTIGREGDRAVVPGELVLPGGSREPIRFLVHWSGRGSKARWRLVDVETEALWHALTLRTALKNTLKKKGYSGLMRVIERHTTQL